MAGLAAQANIAAGAWLLALDTPTLPPATATNTLIVGGERLVVIEPATPHRAQQALLDALLDELLAEGRELAGIALTHHHVDHIGYANELRARYRAPILAHRETAARLAFEVDEELDDGATLELGDGHQLEFVHTPGHAPGHLIVWDHKSDLAHVGDLVAGQGTILVDPGDDGDMAQYLDSLRQTATRVRARQGVGATPRFVPAHGPVLAEPAAVLDHYVQHRLAREAKIHAAVIAGNHSFDAILASAYADTPRQLWPIAALSVEAHLRKLARDGVLVRDGRGARPAH